MSVVVPQKSKYNFLEIVTTIKQVLCNKLPRCSSRVEFTEVDLIEDDLKVRIITNIKEKQYVIDVYSSELSHDVADSCSS